MKPKVFIISGPGGVGKTTLLGKLFRKKVIKENFFKSISYTTRNKRPKEKQGKDYFFVSKEEFLRLIKQKFFLEYEKVVENYYGTPTFLCDQARETRKGLVLCIDVKGGMNLKNNLRHCKVITIFITAPFKELLKRFKNRGESIEVIKKRMDLAKKEMSYRKFYHHQVVNLGIEEACKRLSDILLSS
jgi:guanylate kinase